MATITTKHSSQTESLHARIPQGKLEDIDQIAVSIGRSRNWVFNEALNHYIEMQKWQIDLIKERLDEAKSKTANFTPHLDVMTKQEQRLKAKLR